MARRSYPKTIRTMHAAVRSAQRLMLTDLSAEHTVDDLARSVAFSKFHFSRIFHKTVGAPPIRYLMHQRVNWARCLLLQTNMSVTRITHEIGYSSVGTFTGLFIEIVGVPPTLYRRLRFSPKERNATILRNEHTGATLIIRVKCIAHNKYDLPSHEDSFTFSPHVDDDLRIATSYGFAFDPDQVNCPRSDDRWPCEIEIDIYDLSNNLVTTVKATS